MLWVLVGVYLYAGLTHLQIGLRRPVRRVHVLFGIIALLAAYSAITTVGLATAATSHAYAAFAWHSTLAVQALFLLMPWFFREFVGEQRRWPATVVSGAYLIVLVGNFALPYSMLLSTAPTLGAITLPWGERIVVATTPSHAWLRAFWAAHLLTIAYAAATIVFAFRHRTKATAWGLVLGVGPLAVALIVNILIGIGLVDRIFFVGSFGFMAMVLVMSVVLRELLRRTNRRLKTVLDNVPAIVYIKGSDARYEFVNRRFEEAYDVRAADAIGKLDVELFDSALARERQTADEKVLAYGATIESEETLPALDPSAVDPSGLVTSETRSYAVFRFPLLDAQGRAIAACAVMTDITERQAATDVLRDLTSILERRVARRTTELAQLNRELEAFAYSVSHDLRAPLTAVNGFAELLLREHGSKMDQNANRYLTRIRDASLRMAGLIQDLLGLSRVTQQTLQREPIDLAPLIEASVRSLREQDPARSVTIAVPTHLQAHGDPKLLSLALNNLLTNAWKYTSKISNARIEVGSLQQGADTVYFVRDNGAGFNPDYADRLFRPFVRLHTESEFPGTGIGLATVSRIVSRHGGRVWAEGKVGEGATFYFTLPVPEEDDAVKAA